MPRNYDNRPRVDHGSKSSRMKLNEFFVDGDGINEEVIHGEIERYLGAGAYATPGSNKKGVQGYFVTAIRPFTPLQLDDLQAESRAYEQEQRRRPARQEQPYRVHGDERPNSRTQYLPPPSHIRTSNQPYLPQAGFLPQPAYTSRPEPNYQLGGQYTAPYIGALGQPPQYPYSPYQNRDQYPSGTNTMQNPLSYQPPLGYGVPLQAQPQAMAYTGQTMQTPYSPQDAYSSRTPLYAAPGQHTSPGPILECVYQTCSYTCQRQGDLDRHMQTHTFQPSVGGKRATRG